MAETTSIVVCGMSGCEVLVFLREKPKRVGLGATFETPTFMQPATKCAERKMKEIFRGAYDSVVMQINYAGPNTAIVYTKLSEEEFREWIDSGDARENADNGTLVVALAASLAALELDEDARFPYQIDWADTSVPSQIVKGVQGAEIWYQVCVHAPA
jgi:hypothetical protein